MEQNKNAWAQIVAKAWSDEEFKQKLLNNPKEVCKEYGINLPQGVDLKINDQTEKVIYLNFPKKPAGEMSEEELLATVGGISSLTVGSLPFNPGIDPNKPNKDRGSII